MINWLRTMQLASAQAKVDNLNSKQKGQLSDGYHTFDELYEHRIALFVALCKAIEGKENDSWRTRPVGGWFLMGIGKEKGKQISYHLPITMWPEVSFCEILDKAPEFDGHTSADVLERLKNLI